MGAGRPEDRAEHRRNDRRSGGAAVPRGIADRRQGDRRKIAKGAGAVLMAAMTFAGGSMRSMHRHQQGGVGQGSDAVSSLVLPGLADTPAASEGKTPSGLPIYLNSAVEGAMDTYQGRGRTTFASALSRGDKYLPEIREVFVSEGVPADLAYVALVESEFKPEAQSGAQARGVWQLMPRTGKQLGLAQDFWVDERSDPQKATRAAAKYLKYLHDQFGDWDLALAAYNFGEGNLHKAMKRSGASDFWTLSERHVLPKETRDYVPRIHAAILMAREPAKYGFEVANTADELQVDHITVPEATDLRAVAQCSGGDLGKLLDLNPALKRRATPLNREFVLNVPTGQGAEVTRCVAQLPESERTAMQTHVVSSGQTLASLAKRYNTRVSDITQVNNLRGKRLAKGTELVIPKAGVLLTD
jgi:membrane-bound lytic murein transglycosylase D